MPFLVSVLESMCMDPHTRSPKQYIALQGSVFLQAPTHSAQPDMASIAGDRGGEGSSNNISTVLGIIDKSLNSLRGSSIVDRAAQESPRSTQPSPYGTPRVGGSKSSRATPVLLGSSGRQSVTTPRSRSGTARSTLLPETKIDGDDYTNSVTTELLKLQAKCSALEIENAEMKQTIAKIRTPTGKMPRKGAATPLASRGIVSSPYLPKRPVPSRESDDVSDIMGRIHDHLALRSQDFASRRGEGECIVDHRSMQEVATLLSESLAHLRDDEMARSDWLEEQAAEITRMREISRTTAFEIQECRENERHLKEELEAFEAENMRLTNELSDERSRNINRERPSGNTTENMIAMQAKLNTITAERDQLLKECQEAEARITRFVNEIDGLRNNEQDLLAQLETLQQLR